MACSPQHTALKTPHRGCTWVKNLLLPSQGLMDGAWENHSEVGARHETKNYLCNQFLLGRERERIKIFTVQEWTLLKAGKERGWFVTGGEIQRLLGKHLQGFTWPGWCYRRVRAFHSHLYKTPFCCAAGLNLHFLGQFLCRKVPAQGVTHTHTLCRVFLNPRCRNRSSSGPIGAPLHPRSCGIASPPRDPPMHWKLQDRASKTTSHPQGSFYTQNATQTAFEVDILPPPLLTSVPPAEPTRALVHPQKYCHKMQQTSVQNKQGNEHTPQAASTPRNAEHLPGESCWDEQAAGARCSEQPANSTKKTSQIFETLPLPLNQLEVQQKNETGKN